MSPKPWYKRSVRDNGTEKRKDKKEKKDKKAKSPDNLPDICTSRYGTTMPSFAAAGTVLPPASMVLHERHLHQQVRYYRHDYEKVMNEGRVKELSKMK